MNGKILNYILGILLIIALLIIAFFIGEHYALNTSDNHEKESYSESSNSSYETTNEESNTTIQDNNKEIIQTDTQNIKEDIPPIIENNDVQNDEPVITYTKTDNEVIEEVEEIEDATIVLMEEENETTALEKAKGVFVKLVDFAFYNGEIKGHTFEELSNSGKEKVLALISSLDEKIENKFPGYKESISSTTSSAYKKASEVIKEGAYNINEFSREKLGEENYNAIIDAKDEMVNYYKAVWPVVKDTGGNLINKAKEKIKNWYENFRDN